VKKEAVETLKSLFSSNGYEKHLEPIGEMVQQQEKCVVVSN
jgi:hypothetical protein